MAAEDSPERTIRLGRTPDYYFVGADHPFTFDEIREMPNDLTTPYRGGEIAVSPCCELEYPDGQLELMYPVGAFEGLQHFITYMKKIANHIGDCAVNPNIITVMDSRYSLNEHIEGSFAY